MQEAGIAVGGASQSHFLIGSAWSVAHGVQASQTYRELCGNVGMPCETDWLLLWQQDDKELVLLFLDTGTHSDLF